MMRYRLLRSAMNRYDNAVRAKIETLADVDPKITASLFEVFEPDTLELERITGRDLAAWRKPTW